MKLVRPIAVTDAVLFATNVVESEPVYSAATSYSIGDRVRGDTTPTAHTLFEKAGSSGAGHALSDPTKWIVVGATNRWSCFDTKVQSQTTRADSIVYTLTVPGLVDTVALLNVAGVSARVKQTDTLEGIVFDQTESLVSDSGITDPYRYAFEPIVRLTDMVVTGLKPYASSTVELTITGPAETCALGVLLLGLSLDVGGTQFGAGIGVVDYSVKGFDDFGNAEVVERAFAREANFAVWVENARVDHVVNVLAGFRATPVLYVGDTDFGSTAVFGFFRDFNVEIRGPDVSQCSLEVEGLA